MLKIIGPKNKKPLPVFLKEREMDRLLDDFPFRDAGRDGGSHEAGQIRKDGDELSSGERAGKIQDADEIREDVREDVSGRPPQNLPVWQIYVHHGLHEVRPR